MFTMNRMSDHHTTVAGPLRGTVDATDFVPGEWVTIHGPGPRHYAEQFYASPPPGTDAHYDRLRLMVASNGGIVVQGRVRESTAAAQAGIDPTVCEFCGTPLDDREPWRRGLDGCGAHDGCLSAHLF
jgi:hypothetical protein